VARQGEVVTLDDARFDPKNAKRGLWRPMDFMIHVGAGIYFLDPYDPDRVPVLFVHGINGHPREFTTLVEQLDRSRFQPWVFFYPSGIHLDGLGRVLANLMRDLRARHGFEEVVVVAHSMGGLVARAGILEYGAMSSHPTIRLFVSISTPWAGHAAAQAGVDRAPRVAYSWFDIAPGSDFLLGLFLHDDGRPRRLPSDLAHHLLFGFVHGKGDDGVVSVDSQLRWEAQQQARRLYGLAYDHAGILRAAETSSLLAEILTGSERSD
jgi:pimeloyl-ACP methyl ester carboxylesterase